MHVQPHCLGEGAYATLRRFSVKWHLATEQMWRQVAEYQGGVGERGLAATTPVCQRSRVGTGALRANSQAALGSAARNRAPTRPNRDDVDHRHLDGVAANAAFGRQVWRAVLDDRHVRTGS